MGTAILYRVGLTCLMLGELLGKALPVTLRIAQQFEITPFSIWRQWNRRVRQELIEPPDLRIGLAQLFF